MKIGIMSMQRIPNNGSFLQSYSLKRNLEMMGHEVVFVDYKPGPVLVKRSKEKKNAFVSNIQKIKKHFLFPRKNESAWNRGCDEFKVWEKEYHKEMMPILNLPKESQYELAVDLLVIGSDEVFNCLQPSPHVGYARQLFGADSNAKKVISYAASFGNTSLAGLKEYKIEDDVKNMLSKMDAISVRDVNSKKIVSALISEEPYYHVDPVFLYDYTDEMPSSVNESGYIVVYAYTGRINQKEAKHILEFAKKYNKKIVCLAGAQEYFGDFIKTNPFETLTYVKNADYVITDTFHGTVFSIKFNKNFASIIRSGEGAAYGNSNKMQDLLARFGLEDHILEDCKRLEQILTLETDFTGVNKKIYEEKQKSLEYLSSFCN